MKLYTEEQMIQAFAYGRTLEPFDSFDDMINSLKPIELPSDDEIEEMGRDVCIYNQTKRGWFVEGLKFMREKIQGGNK